jgi:hypothetical protein
VTTAIGELPELEREIITMLIWDELAPREVAAILGLSPNVVRVRAHRARTKLKAALTGTEERGEPEPPLTLEVAAETLAHPSTPPTSALHSRIRIRDMPD